MTEFLYANEEQIVKLSTMFCKEGITKVKSGPWNINIFKYLISYWALTGKRIMPWILDEIRSDLGFDMYNVETKIFFEKIESSTLDRLYFMEYMKKVEKDPEFLETWQKCFLKIA